MLGKSVDLSLVPDLSLVCDNDEVATSSGKHGDDGIGKALLDGGGQTGRSGLVVSDYAVFDGYVHPARIAEKCGARLPPLYCARGLDIMAP